MTSARLSLYAHNGIEPPKSFLRSPAKILLWRALVNGEHMHKHLAAARFRWHASSASRAISELHSAGKVYIVGWTRNGDRGPLTKIIAFGHGEDKPYPEPLSNAFVCRRWRERHPDQAIAIDRRCRLKKAARQGTLPRGNDPLLAAIMGARL